MDDQQNLARSASVVILSTLTRAELVSEISRVVKTLDTSAAHIQAHLDVYVKQLRVADSENENRRSNNAASNTNEYYAGFAHGFQDGFTKGIAGT